MAVITFDFDNTIAMSQMKIENNKANLEFEGYNSEILKLIINNLNLSINYPYV